MDKLDKLTPKDLTPLKSNIAQGVISNTIFAVAWNGASAMIAWVAGHYALIFGIPPFLAISLGVVLFFLMALSYNLLRRRKDARALNATSVETLGAANTNNDTKPTIEILSPFDNDEVGLFETVRGRVFPPEQELQVVVFAGDEKWYPQRAVSVKGSTWSVKCQFGNLDSPSGGAYKVVALLGNELKGGMWYRELPAGTPKSNIISVHRPEVTIEQKLQTATNAFTDMEQRVETLTAEKTNLERDLLAETRLKESIEAGQEIRRRELLEVKSDADAQKDTYELTFKGMSEELRAAQHEAKQANLRTNELRGTNESLLELKREAERKLADLKWLTKLAEDQAVQLSDHIRVEVATYPHCGEMQLSGKDLCVLLGLSIKNESVFEIAIEEKKITGQFSLNNVAFREKADQLIDTFRAPLRNLKPQQKEMIVIEQPLREFEAEKIKRCLEDPDAKFWIGGVRVPISINNQGFEVKNEPCLLWGSGEVPLKNFKRNTDNP
jgi:hypothetical protein